MANHWLNFVGRSYYTERTFIKEAKLHLASRRANLRILGGFEWGDIIWLAQGDMQKSNRRKPFSGSRIFAFFTLTQIGGLNWAALNGYPGLGKLYDDRAKEIHRGCGSYTEESIYVTNSSPKSLSDYLRESAIPTTVLLQGPITPLDNWISIPDIGFRLGYRRIPDPRGVLLTPRAKGYEISGDLTAQWEPSHPYEGDTFLETVSGYSVAELYSKPEYYDDYA